MKKLNAFWLAILSALSFVSPVLAQGIWTQKTDAPPDHRYQAFGISVAGKGYVGCGLYGDASQPLYHDLREFDPATNAWTQKTDHPGTAFRAQAAFVVNGKIYVCGGLDLTTPYSEMYEFDPATNVWTQKANYPGGPRENPFAFGIGSKGYVGGGYDGSVYRQDFYQYDPATDTWTQKADFGGGTIYKPSTFVLNGKGYTVCGSHDGTPVNWVYSYDPATNVWTQKSNFSGTARFLSVGLETNGFGYFGTGYDGANYLKDFWRYDPTLDAWAQVANAPDPVRNSGVGFSIGDKGYFGTGSSTCGGGCGFTMNDFWEFSPPDCLNRAMKFDGSTQFAEISDNPELNFCPTCPMTVEGWVFRTGSEPTQHILGKRINCDGSDFWQVYFNAVEGLRFGGSGGWVSDPAGIPIGQWTHFAGVFDGANLNLYVNGILKASSAGTLGVPANHPLRFATSGTCSNDQFFEGEMDEIRFWNTARTATQIANFWDKTFVNAQPGMLAYYKFDDIENLGQGTAGDNDLRDFSGNNFHGDLIGGSTLTCNAPILTGVCATPIAPTFTPVKPSCNGGSNGKLTVNPTSPVTGYTYLWETGATTRQITNLPAGTYTVTVTKTATGCSVEGTGTVTEPTPVTISLSTVHNKCYGQMQGKVSALASGGTGTKTYLWNTGSTAATITNLSGGDYSVTATDAKNCTAEAMSTVSTPSELMLDYTVETLANGKFKVTLSASGGTPYTTAVQYRFCKVSATGSCAFSTTSIYSNLLPGTYTFKARDKNACETSVEVTVPQSLMMNDELLMMNSGADVRENSSFNIHNLSFIITPNPFDNQLIIAARTRGLSTFQKLTNLKTSSLEVRVFDAVGRLAASQTFPAGSGNLKLETQNFSPGVYQVQVLNAEGRVLEVLRAVKVD